MDDLAYFAPGAAFQQAARDILRTRSGMSGLGQPVPEASAVSAIVKDALGRSYPGITIKAVLEQTGSTIAEGKTGDDGRVKFDLPSKGLSILLTPSVGPFWKSIPEQVRKISLPTAGVFKDKWGWDESAQFTVLPKKIDDFLTFTNILIAGGIAIGVWWFFIRKDD